MRSIVLLSVLLLICQYTEARQHRSTAAKAEFQRLHPCPSTGQHRGKCPGFIIDHIDPLCNHGKDEAANMQWQTIADAKEKDRWERQLCRRNR